MNLYLAFHDVFQNAEAKLPIEDYSILFGIDHYPDTTGEFSLLQCQ